MLDNAAAWIDCEVEAVYEAGDHYIVIGRVWDLDAEDDVLPLLFFRGGYGQFAPLSLAAIDDDLLDHLRVIDLGRGEMEAVAAELHTECIATAAIGDELVLLATAGRPRTPGVSTRVGQRVPFVPAFGAAFLAWASEGAAEAVLRRWWPALPADLADNYRRVLERVRTRGFSIGLGLAWHAQLEQALSQWYANPASLKARDAVRRLIDETAAEHYDPVDLAPDGPYEVCTLNAPVFGPDGDVLLVMSLYGFPDRLDFDEVQTYVARLLEATQKVTRVSRGRVPA
jgi:DNA-binding IclR family transcriptional regulator